MALTPVEVVAHLPRLMDLYRDLGDLIDAVRLAKEDDKVSPTERLHMRRLGVKLLRSGLPVFLAIAMDVVD